MTGIVQDINDVQIDGTLRLTLKASVGTSLISGLELIRVGQ